MEPEGQGGHDPAELVLGPLLRPPERPDRLRWYGQGTRILDISDPENPIQVAYFRPDGGNVWASYWFGDYVIVADNARGIDILKLTAGQKKASAAREDLAAPAMSKAQQSFLRELETEEFAADPQLGWVCPLPRN